MIYNKKRTETVPKVHASFFVRNLSEETRPSNKSFWKLEPFNANF